MTSRALTFVSGVLLIALAGCETAKSSTPTAPTVAGPIAGVTISAPVLLQPSAGFKFKEAEQPIQLVIQNATTTGVRPLTYTFEVATDSGFGSKVFSRSNVAPGDGKSTVTLDPLPIDHKYYWRAWAQDGANVGDKAASGFEIYPKASVAAPSPISPVNNEEVGSTTPTIVVANAATIGPVGYLAYEFQVASDQAFTRLVAAGIVNEGAGQTTFSSSALTAGVTLFWRVRAADSETQGPWSQVQTFRTPKPVGPPPPAGGGGGGGPTGDWQSCSSLVADKPRLSSCVHDAVNPAAGSADAAFEVTKRIAWLLRGEGAGLLIKNGGENITAWQGYSFSSGRICYPNGQIYKVVGDVGGANTASWSDNGFVDKSLYVPAIDPGK